MFEEFVMWCRKDCRSLGQGWARFTDALIALEPVSEDCIARFEHALGEVLPEDLRRVMVDIGDVGAPLFGAPILQFPPAWDPGPWLWDKPACLRFTSEVGGMCMTPPSRIGVI